MEDRVVAVRKNRPVLFEVARRNRKASEYGRRRPAESSPPVHIAAEREPVRPASEPESSGPEVPTPVYPAAMRVEGGKVNLSLSTPMAAVLGAALLVVVVVAFQAGRGSARPAGTIGGGGALLENSDDGAPADMSLVGGEGSDEVAVPERGSGAAGASDSTPAAGPGAAEGGAAGNPPVAAFRLEAGLHYLVIQYFRERDQDKAIAARDFLRERGVECAVIRRGPDYVLVAKEAFQRDHKDAATRAAEIKRSDALQARVKELGKEYASKGYSFRDCRFEKVRSR